MGKITLLGLAPKDHPMFSGGVELFSRPEYIRSSTTTPVKSEDKPERQLPMTIDDILKIYKTQRQIATALGVTEAAVANWKSRGNIPLLQQVRLMYLSDGRLMPADDIFTKGKGNY